MTNKRRQKKHRNWWSLFVFAGFFFVLGFIYRYHLPRIESWIGVEIERLSQLHSPVRIWPQGIKLHLLPLGLTLEKVRILPQKELKDQLAPSQIDKIEVFLSYMALLKGQLRIGKLRVEGGEFTYFPPPTDPSSKPFSIPFSRLYQIPLDDLEIDQVNFMTKIDPLHAAARLENVRLNISNRYDALLVDAQIQKVQLKKINQDVVALFAIESRLLIQKDKVNLTALKIKKTDSYLVASGSIRGAIDQFKVQSAQVNTRLHASLKDVRDEIQPFISDQKLPIAGGHLDLDVEYNQQVTAPLRLKFKISSTPLSIAKYEIGQIEAQGQLANHEIRLPHLKIRQSGAHVNLNDSVIKLKDNLKFQTNLKIHRFELRQFLNSIDVGDTPLKLTATGETPCTGQVQPELTVKCKGQIHVDTLHVWSGSEKDKLSIVNMNDIQLGGEVSMDDKKLTYNSSIAIGESSGSSSGEISYDKGFKIKYQGSVKRFKTFNKIANLQIEGSADIEGTTQGNSSYGIVDMKVSNKNIWLENWQIGNGKFKLRYKEGLLNFRQIQGFLGHSQYNGNVTVNLLQDKIFLAMKSKYIDLEDIQKGLSRHLKLPFDVRGSGSAKARIWGPLQFNRLSCDLTSSFYRGQILGESFDQLTVNMEAKDGHLSTKNVQLTKANGRLSFNGKLLPNGYLDAVLLGQDLFLEQTDWINQTELNLAGKVDFTSTLKGSILNPDLTFNSRLTRTVIGQNTAKDSSLRFEKTHHTIQGKTQLLGDTLTGEFIIPFDNQSPFFLAMTAKDWNFTQILSVFREVDPADAYSSSLSGSLHLKAPQGGFWKSSGSIQIDKFLLSRGQLSMQSSHPMHMGINQGVLDAKNIEINGPNSFVRFQANNSSRSNLNMEVEGKMDVGLFSLFTPFLEDLKGDLAISMKAIGPFTKPEILGSAYLQNGTVKLREFPHPFRELKVDALFSQNKILLNSVHSTVAGGQLSAAGRVSIEGIRKVPVEISGQFKDVSLNIPEGFGTKGYGTVNFTGDWFPYLLSGSYEVTYGDVNRDFSSENNQKLQVQKSSYLPHFLLEKSFEPISLDLKLNLKRPVITNLTVNNVKVETSVNGNLQVRGSPSTPRLTGQLNTIPGGKVTFRSNTFDIRSGLVEYQNRPPENPDLLVSAQTRVTTNEGDDYDITMLVQGSALDPSINLSSQPPLNETELVSLLALGLTSQDLDQNLDSNQQVAQTSFQLGSTLLQEKLGLGKGIKDRLGFEVDISSSVASDTTIPKVTLRKQWTPKFGASASRTIEKVPRNDVKFEYKFNRNFSVVGSWETSEAESATQTTTESDVSPSKMGLDLEYKIEFK